MTEYHLSFNTPEKIIFEGQVSSIIVPGYDGYLEILAHHAPIITLLQPGKVTVTFSDQEKHTYAVSDGFLEVSNNIATLLVDSAENASEISRFQAEKALKKAEKNLESESIDIARAKKALARAKNRLKIYDDTHGQD